MSENSNSIAIVYPANWPEDDPEAHCTILYLGKISESAVGQQQVQEILDRIDFVAPGSIPTKGLEFFGPEKDISVVTLELGMYMRLVRDTVEAALEAIGSGNASEFKDYKPHVTISDPEMEIPRFVTLGKPVLWWGDDRGF